MKALTIILILASVLFADYYSVRVTRISDNLYYDRDIKMYIVTEYCNKYCYDEFAVLEYDKYSYCNYLIFGEYEKYRVLNIYFDK